VLHFVRKISVFALHSYNISILLFQICFYLSCLVKYDFVTSRAAFLLFLYFMQIILYSREGVESELKHT